MKLSQLKPNPENPRIIKDDKFKKLVKSLQEFPEMMDKRPMVCVTDEDGKLYPLGGNMRLRALQELKYKDIPDTWIMFADDWSEEKRREFTIKDNSNYGEWDFDELANSWDNDPLSDWGLDVPNFEQTEESEEIQEKTISAFNKTHILISFQPYLMIEIQDYLQKIKDTIGVEYEQSSN
jgi:ParB-like chromosome segregation protein Spo0J